MEVGIIKY